MPFGYRTIGLARKIPTEKRVRIRRDRNARPRRPSLPAAMLSIWLPALQESLAQKSRGNVAAA